MKKLSSQQWANIAKVVLIVTWAIWVVLMSNGFFS